MWSHIPAGLDHISLDVYPGDGRTEPAVSQQYAERYFLPLLQPHQSLWVVPGLFGRNDTQGNATTMASTDATLLAKVTGYWEWAAKEPRLTGFLPWHCKYATVPRGQACSACSARHYATGRLPNRHCHPYPC